MDDERKPWSRQDGEPLNWYKRFAQFYLSQVGTRSLLAAVNAERDAKGKQRSNNVGRTWRESFVKWRWKDRAGAYDEQQANLAVDEWTRRQAEHREREWEAARKLLDKALQMLQFPLARVVKNGEQTTIMPAGWSMRDASALAETASKLARLSADMSQGRFTVTDQELNAKIERELARLAPSSKAEDAPETPGNADATGQDGTSRDEAAPDAA